MFRTCPSGSWAVVPSRISWTSVCHHRVVWQDDDQGDALSQSFPHGKTLRTAGNLNNHLGVPLSLCRLSADDQFAVFELGMNALGEIAELTDWVKPHVGVITSIGAAHLEGVGSLSGVAKAKGELFEGLTESDVAVCPSDIPHLEYLQRVSKSAIKTVGSRVRSTSY